MDINLVRKHIKERLVITDDELLSESLAVAASLGVKPEQVDESYAELIASEIDKGGGLAIASSKEEKALSKNGKKSKPVIQTQSVNPEIKAVIQNSVTGAEKIYQTVNNFYDQLESDRSNAIIKRAKSVNSNILASVIETLQSEADSTDSFCSELEQMLREAHSGF